jgi:hypothetical protein
MWHFGRGLASVPVVCLALLCPLLANGGLASAESAAPQAVSSASAARCPSGDAGASVGISGSLAIIGAWNAHNYRGSACIYQRSARGVWRLQSILNDPHGKKFDGFGYKVAVSATRSGTFAVVSAPGNYPAPSMVYIYARVGTTWRRRATLPDPAKSDNFGQSVAIAGTTVVVGADSYSIYNGLGHVYVYTRPRGSWHLQAKLTGGQDFGSDVAISGSTVIVGDGEQPSPAVTRSTQSDGLAANSGSSATVYVRSGSRWRVQARLASSFPQSVALSGNVAVVGEQSSGAVRVFTRSGSRWHRSATLHGPFGNAVAVTGRDAVIGGPYADNSCGAAYVFEASGARWRLRVKLVPPSCPKNTLELFGWSVAASGRTAVVGQGYGGAYVMNFP